MHFRRAIIAASVALALPIASSAAQPPLPQGSLTEAVEQLAPGQYLWAPQMAPQGPMLLAVSLAKQRAVLYRNGIPIGVSTVSTGKDGHETPTGVFTILQKRVDHKSNLYNDAPMPFMQRLTWSGVALHAGNLPGYPASHGCIRLPLAFAQLLYGETRLGMTVVVTDQPALPKVAPTPELLGRSEEAVADQTSPKWNPERSPKGPISIIISAADETMLVLRSGVVIGSAPIKLAERLDETAAFTLKSKGPAGQQWLRIGLPGQAEANVEVPAADRSKLSVSEEFRSRLASLVESGPTVVVTPDSLVAGSTGAAVTVFESDDEPHP